MTNNINGMQYKELHCMHYAANSQQQRITKYHDPTKHWHASLHQA